MEIGTANISDIVSKLRSIGVFPSHDIAKLFDIVSALKSAYVRLQEAHVPHDPNMIVAADRLVVAELEALYKEKRHFAKSKSKPSRFAQSRARLEELKSRLKAKSSEAARLASELRGLESGNARLSMVLEREVRSDLDVRKAFEAASKSIHDFAKPLIGLMKAGGWDLDRAAKSIEGEAVFSMRSHKKYAFEAYIARRMFGGAPPAEAYDLMIARLDDRDPIDALMEDPGSGFARFCGEKYLAVVHRAMEASFFGNLDHRELVSMGKHPRTPFYQIFARMARRVWVLRGVVGSLCPGGRAFGVGRRSRFSDVYMESVVEEDSEACGVGKLVEFMVMPGFKIGDTVVKSRVYIS